VSRAKLLPLRLCFSLLVSACGCAAEEPAPDVSEEPPVEAAPRPESVPIDVARTTQDPHVAITNRDGQIDALRERVATTHPPYMSDMLIGLLLSRAGLDGSYDDFAEADALSAAAVERLPDSADAHASRAAYLSAVHRFDEALEELEIVESLGGNPDAVERRRIAIGVAVGDDPEPLIARAEALLAVAERYEFLMVYGSALAAAGRFEDADDAYNRALATYRDISPFPVAQLAFVRGVMWAEMADRPDLGIGLYREAVRRLPSYVVANTHLAELESETDDVAGARARLERFSTPETGDPEPAGRLAEILADSDPERAASLRTQASTRYERLLSRHRLAFLDHGAEFFSGVDPPRGLALSLENLESRRNARAHVVAIEAALAAEQPDVACRVARDGEPFRGAHPVLDHVIADLDCP